MSSRVWQWRGAVFLLAALLAGEAAAHAETSGSSAEFKRTRDLVASTSVDVQKLCKPKIA